MSESAKVLLYTVVASALLWFGVERFLGTTDEYASRLDIRNTPQDPNWDPENEVINPRSAVNAPSAVRAGVDPNASVEGTPAESPSEGDVEEEDLKVPTVRTRAERRERLQMVPEVLILQLQRFTQTPRGGLRKLSGHVPFPLDLDMSPYMAPPAKGAGGPADGTAASDAPPSPPSVQAAARAAKKHKKSRPQSAVAAASASADGSAPSEDGVASVASLRKGETYHAALETMFIRPAPSQAIAAERLDLPFSTFRRHLARGIELVVEALWTLETR